MVEAGTDPDVVTEKILRESAAARAELRTTDEGDLAVGDSASGVAAGLAVEPPPAPPPPPDAATSYRHGRLAVVAVLVLVLIWAWIVERRGRANGGNR